MNMKVKISGIMSIMRRWFGSPALGVIHCWRNMLAPMKSVSTGMPAGKADGHQAGTVKASDFQSGCGRSLIHRNVAWRSSIGVRSAL